jgi:long-chain acyl-CoA synthetase
MEIFESDTDAQTIIDAVNGKTMVDFFYETLERNLQRQALRAKTDETDSGTDKVGTYSIDVDGEGTQWRTYTWEQYGDAASRFASALTDLGVNDDERVMLLLRNCPAFHVVDVGTMIHGATPVSIYHSSSAEQIKYLIDHSGASVIVVEHPAFAERVAEVASDLASLNHVIMVEDPATLSAQTHDQLSGVNVHYLHDLIEAAEPASRDEAREATTPEDYATIIYTSGTTGPPKGVALKQRNITFTTESLVKRVELDPDGWRVVSYLPMAHIAERMVSHYLGIRYGWSLTCCPDPTLVSQYLAPTQPHALFAVPRIWEKAYATINALVGEDRAEFDRALEMGLSIANRKAQGEEITQAELDEFAPLNEQHLAPWRAVLGLDQCLVAVSGAAPLPSEIMSFFRGLQLPVSEIYGLSETCGPLTWSPNHVRIGFVGSPIPGETVALADDGEVLVKGGNIFEGYLNDDEKTREAIDEDGWFHTGDIGQFDEGQMRIVDRKKELIITAGGKNVSPSNIEAHLKASPYISAACVVGDGQKYLGALIALEADALQFWAMMAGIEGTHEDLSKNEALHAEIQKAVDAANEFVSSAEHVRKFVVLDHEWLPDSDVLTPTMKLKRRVVKEKYKVEIDSMFS